VVSTSQPTLGEWLGSHRAPVKLAGRRITVLRAADGPGLACAPDFELDDADVQSGEQARAILEVLKAFEQPRAVGEVSPRFSEAIDALAASGFLTAGR
jgi:hypothetical protein